MNANRNRVKRLAYQEEGRRLARLGDPLLVSGCMLYWAEGAKTRTRVVQMIFGAIQEIGGFTRDAWLE
jgi:hypothetical protein